VTVLAAGTVKFRLASPPTAVVLCGIVVALFAAGFPLSHLAHLGVSSGGSGLVLGPVFTVIGFIVAWRKPANPLGWLLLGAVAFLALTGDASAYAVADYRWHHGALPLGWVAMLLQPAWAPAIALFGLSVLLFPDGRPPGRRWRWWLWGYLAVAAAWIAGTIIITAGAIIAHNIHVDSAGDLQALNHPAGPSAWWGAVQTVFFPVLGVCWLASLGGQAVSYRRSSGDRRLQLKWLLGGAALFTPVRRRVQRAVDRRFNRARYDADRTVAAFAARLQDAVDLRTVHADLTATISASLQPAHLSVTLQEPGP
jgi:hypothetical protein